MFKIKTSLYFISSIFILLACSKSNESTESNNNNNGGSNNCNTTGMQFARDIVPILQTSCYSCHSNANVGISGISLEGYNNVKVRVNDGKLIGSITHASGFKPMPQGGAKLSDCNIEKIRSWINSGAPNN